jgi:hypothetical protein
MAPGMVFAALAAVYMFSTSDASIAGTAEATSGPTVLSRSGCCVAMLEEPQLAAPHPQIMRQNKERCITMPGEEQLRAGSKLKPGQRFRFSHPNAGDYIDIGLPDGQRYTVNCSGWLGCRRTYRVPNPGAAIGWFSAALGMLANAALVGDEPKAGCCLNNRGSSGTDEMVLENVGNQVNVAKMLFDAPTGTYMLRFASHPAGTGAPAAQLFTITVPVLDPDATDVGPIKPGLYTVTIDGPSSRLYWILAADHSHYAPADRALRDAKAFTYNWNSRDSVHNFLRAYLAVLARQSTGK